MLDAKNYGDFMAELLFHLRDDKSKWETRDDFLVYCDFDNALFQKVTGLNKIPTSVNEVVYEKCEDNKYKLFFTYFVNGNVIYNDYFVFNGDALELFEPGETKSEYADMTVENFFNDNMESVIQKLKDYAPDVVEEIEDRFLRRLTVPDLTCPLYEEVVEDYMKNNREKMRVAFIKDFLKTQLEIEEDYIKSNNLE